jgi:ubiquinone/menaquinone biosynthesis C-methylase UbiE
MAVETAPAVEYWEQVFSSRPWGAYPNEGLVRFIGRQFRGDVDRSNVRVLEIGCGPGPNIWFLVREGFQVAGIDCSPTAIRQAKEKLVGECLPCEPPTVDLRLGSFSSLPWSDEEFDVVVDIEALYANTMADIRQSVAEILRTLKPGGLFFGAMFGVRTTGSNSGETIEPGTQRQPIAGPCAGNQLAHFFDLQELTDVFSNFGQLTIDQLHRTDAGGQVDIFEWLVQARK